MAAVAAGRWMGRRVWRAGEPGPCQPGTMPCRLRRVWARWGCARGVHPPRSACRGQLGQDPGTPAVAPGTLLPPGTSSLCAGTGTCGPGWRELC